ncbi:hypothetical protein [Sulfuriroseicoccus oceanibius]|uniref:Uncharacterized protein n=1 Tax=Sulfuriroseicoccus oceanibius TaxID=2707525 RepID=A0A6B3LBX3_9BACT|nr:hypothetical protein [Sulfuriroseicoccus oceanibius]QQL45251.1 hypothetical protein G3M56_001290 [Sulfuriroseicoccus oceanibius]
MNTASVVTLVVLSSAASAGITWMATKNSSPAEAAPPAVVEKTVTNTVVAATDAPAATTPEATTPWSGATNTTAKQSREESTRPEGVSEEVWERATQQAGMMQMWGKRMEQGGQRWMNRNVDRDSQRIANHLGLDEAGSERINQLLRQRMEKAAERPREIFSRLTANNDVLAELIALREMGQQEGGLNAELAARQEQLQREVLGEYYPEDGSLDERGIMGMMRPQMPERWYRDEALLTEMADGLDDQSLDSLSEYATRMDYLDRENQAYRSSTRIERRIPLDEGQSNALFQLYLENENPSREQLGQILTPEQLEKLGE